MNVRSVLIALSALCGAAHAQTLAPCYIADSTDDAIYRCVDLNNDGDYDDALEVTVFYSETLGPFSLDLPIGSRLSPSGVLYVCDGGTDQIYAMVDLNDDGDAHDALETTIFFDGNPGGNASAVTSNNAQDLSWDPTGQVMYVVDAGSGGVDDSLLRLQDLNNDGDANDLGEAVRWYVPAPGGAGGDSVPQDVRVGNDGAVYYLEAASSGSLGKGVYRLVDLDMSGTIDQPNEATPFYVPTTSPFGFPTSLLLAGDGNWYVTDSTNDRITRFFDANVDKVITEGVEDSLWYQSPAASILWELDDAADGSFYAAESQAPDRILRFVDIDMSGSIDPMTEVQTVYTDTLAAIDFGNPRAIAVDSLADLFTEFCNGDGGDQMGCTNCPCGNNAAPGTIGGCVNSNSMSARLEPSGSPSVMADTMRYEVTGANVSTFGVLISANNQLPQMGACPPGSGLSTAILDGLRCVGGAVQRHGSRATDGLGNIGVTNNGWGPPSGPAGGLIAQGGFVAGQTRHYQCFYREVASLGCLTGQNTTNAVSVTFAP